MAALFAPVKTLHLPAPINELPVVPLMILQAPPPIKLYDPVPPIVLIFPANIPEPPTVPDILLLLPVAIKLFSPVEVNLFDRPDTIDELFALVIILH